MKFAAIDIGSNAIRLLFYNVLVDGEHTTFRKVSLIRMPVRLGADVFATKIISEAKLNRLTKTMIAFKHLMDVHEVVAYKAYATSAMREADNKEDVIRRVYNDSGIQINIIDGEKEAKVIHSNRLLEKTGLKNGYIFMDVGGGSTEVSFFAPDKDSISHSYKLGTVRMLANAVNAKEFDRLKNDLKNIKKNFKGEIIAIGSGGNINRLFKLSGIKEGKPLPVKKLKEMYEEIQSLTYEERMAKLGLNMDRADVIEPAAYLYLFVCKQLDIKTMLVPKIGLSDGIITELYNEYLESNKHI